MGRKALCDAVRPYAPGGKLLPIRIPLFDGLGDAFFRAKRAGSRLGASAGSIAKWG